MSSVLQKKAASFNHSTKAGWCWEVDRLRVRVVVGVVGCRSQGPGCCVTDSSLGLWGRSQGVGCCVTDKVEGMGNV